MRACPVCGTLNEEGDDFCSNCGSYLGWSGPDQGRQEPPASAAGTAGAPGPAEDSPAQAPPAAEPSAPAAPTGRTAPSEAPKAEEPDEGTVAAPAPEPAPARETPAPATGPQAPAAGPPRAPVPQPRAEVDPVAVQPARPVAPRPAVRQSPAETPRVGPPCPRCGTPNEPSRKFCRRCGLALTPTAQQEALPWWRTRWPFRRRVRRGGSGHWVRRFVTLLVVAALVVAGVLLYPQGRAAYEDIRDKLGHATAISPTGTTASASVPGHPADLATDGLTNRYWGAPAVGASIHFTFRAPFRLVDLVIHTGDSTDPEAYRKEGRATELDLVTTSKDGTVTHKALDLDDRPGSQTVQTGISDVVDVTVVVKAAAGTGPGRHIALGEVEFFRRS